MKRYSLTLWHTAHKTARVLFIDENNPYTDMATARTRACKVLFYLIHTNVTVIDFKKKLYWALQPHIEATHTCCFYDRSIIQIP